MSVRRLAEDHVQPQGFAFNEENAAWAQATIKKYPEGRQQSAVIPLLMRAQEQQGWVTRSAIEKVADMLEMPYIRVLEVATFYTQFQLKPVGARAHVQVCGTTPCMLRGAEELIEVCKRKIHPDPFERNAQGTLSWEEVECQGACVNAPMVMIFKDAYEDLTPTQLEHIIDRFEAGRGADIRPGPQTDRIFSAPAGGLTTLLEGPTLAVIEPVAASTDAAVSVPPSNAAKPVTDSDITNPALTSPADGATALPSDHPSAKPAKPENDALTKPSLDDANRPKAIERPQTPDNLQLITGIGPKIEGILHDIGIFTFAQIAAFTEAERNWVDGYLNFKGRIERDAWIDQAKALATGGEAEYIRVFGKKPR